GRPGVGAVMGSKNLKAIVIKGDKKIDQFDASHFKAFHNEIISKFKADSKETPSVLREYGTSYGVGVMNSYGILPTKNFQKGTYENWEKINANVLKKNHLIRNKACFACPIGCGRFTEVKTPGFEGKGEGPEYETIYALGSNCMVDNFSAVVKANYLCNELGLDTITMGATIACAMELNEKGYLSEKIIGSPLTWGDAKALVDLTRMTAYREGFGDWLAEGSFHLAKRVGHPELAMVAKKQEFAGYDPRGIQGMGLAYATSPIGGSHMRGDPAYFEIFGHPVKIDPFEWKGKAKLVKISQDLSCIFDSAGLCIFFAARNLVSPNLEMEPIPIQKYLNAATGAEYSLEELQQAGERIFNAERVFLVRAGFTGADDTLPDRLTKVPMPDGPAKGHVCHLDEMLEEYYPERGWDENGIPQADTLERLGLQL
ncbi:MAG: aldehyde ferredoxin oxidoreductase, partial [Deltaproteobacteria bacterium]|nr:aldehyde ferredoxin oxidoreductase [Deltaproteobacteria bacterium]